MKLSEAIREGCKISHPLKSGQYVDYDWPERHKNGRPEASALGAAYLTLPEAERRPIIPRTTSLIEKWPELRILTSFLARYNLQKLTLLGLLTVLNDDYPDVTREDIADFVEWLGY